MMKKISVILLLAVLLLTACNPLRRVQRNQKADSTTVNRSEIQKIVTDILRESGSVSQTVIEFYPPTTSNKPEPAEPVHVDNALSAEPPVVPPPAIKRIVQTDIRTEAERTITSDSLARNDIHSTTHSDLEEKVVEKPPASVLTIKWIAIGLVALLLLIVILKLSKIKIPGIK